MLQLLGFDEISCRQQHDEAATAREVASAGVHVRFFRHCELARGEMF